MYRKFVAVAILTLVSFGALAGVRVTNLDLRLDGANGFVTVALEGRSKSLPDVKVQGNTIEITLDNAAPFAAIMKTVRGASLTANVLNGRAIVRAALPYAIDPSQVNLGWKNAQIEVLFPRGSGATASTAAKAPAAPAAAPEVVKAPAGPEKKVIAEPKVATVTKKEDLNEDYLNKLMHENKAVAAAPEAKDEVKTAAAAPARVEVAASPAPKANQNDTYSFAGYAAKFTIFLAIVLGLFYGAVQILKRGVFNKGKLGFLNNGKMIEVLSTTYVAPKKSLMIVKAHKQLFLVANSENGIQFLAEMKDTTGIIKEGEKAVTGTNFDLSMFTAEAAPEASTVTLKENIMESTPVNDETPLTKIAKATDVVKFSEELKKKAKKLKPIEFN